MLFRNKKRLTIILKLIVACGLGLLFYKQLFSGGRFPELADTFIQNRKNFNYSFLLLCVLLMPVNWLLEALKWKYLTSAFQPLRFKDALASVLSGVSLGVITPARIGEYGGRMLYLKADHKIQSIGATLTGSIAQNTINAAVAVPLSYYFLKTVFDVTYGWSSAFLLLITAGVVLSMLVYYHIGTMLRIAGRMPFLNNRPWILNKFGYAAQYDRVLLHKVILLALARYLIYSLQYLCVAWFFDFGFETHIMTGAIATIYLVQSGIPLPPVMGLMARGELAVLVWSQLHVDAITALGATLLLWTINLMIPALAGLWYIWKARI